MGRCSICLCAVFVEECVLTHSLPLVEECVLTHSLPLVEECVLTHSLPLVEECVLEECMLIRASTIPPRVIRHQQKELYHIEYN